jgi:hypothetical protein
VAKQADGGKWQVFPNAFVHDGSKLSQVSAALAYGSKVIMGSPCSRGVLLCDIPSAAATARQ